MLRSSISLTTKRCISVATNNDLTPPSLQSIKNKFHFFKTMQSVNDLKLNDSTVTLNGWIDSKPKKIGKNLIFGTFRDINGSKIQLVDSQNLLKNLNVEDCIQLQGKVKLKKVKKNTGLFDHNDLNNTEKYEISVSSLNILNSANKKPSQLYDLLTTENEANNNNFPAEYRYLQLRQPKYQSILKKRYEANKCIRNVLDSYGFIEVETPLLFKSTPEGAREFIVPTRNTSKFDNSPLFYALPQSPQQYKQLLMASGVHRYFQVAKCFRDEDLRADRQPEFTQIDMELSFANSEDVMEVVSDVVCQTWSKIAQTSLQTVDSNNHSIVLDIPVNTNKINTITYEQAMTKYGIDKPDLRFPQLQIINMSELGCRAYENEDYPIFEILIMRKAFTDLTEYSQNWESLLVNEDNYNYRVPTVVPITTKNNEIWFENFTSFATFENPKLMNKILNLEPGDIVLGSTREPNQLIFENPTPLGRARQLIIKNELGKKLYQVKNNNAPVASWVVDFPLFSPVEEKPQSPLINTRQQYPKYKKNEYTATHHPFTMLNIKDYDKFQNVNKDENMFLQTKGLHYDLVINGVELGGGSRRIHDPVLQKFIFDNILKVKNDDIFKHLLNAFEMGCPPHAGFAIGFDRMCAMMCNLESIRDVIAFPKSVTGSDLVVGSPSFVDDRTLKEYNIETLSTLKDK
ncbi:related to Aspartate--tRNA ligase, mitochondrial [Saccharomycodes ludwigii]|uniref:Related to Aspartate--tRNA ligase, mitochondrial n=1 Tax=Saccharomycodes ludwigii TaxID=36035 RepID=A0A376B760_9ASCO|nr:hypothetical protein SCDLUD_002056 [Saccharomycodes ludwigii]KAH3902239.1 hypothetical protein SCDLUD_002056 [Saccharomycodes ludwigii]SSD60419.1 related to Aspartate--tRNA ligase, mitochondrial [Saccharomycodes ludwigii]